METTYFSGNSLKWFTALLTDRDQGGKLLRQAWWSFKCCDFKMEWRQGSIISHPWIREQWACLFVRGCITPGMINVSMLWWSQWDMSRVMGDGQCLGATGHAGSGWWPMPIDIWYHSFHSQHSHIINVSNPHLYSPALHLSWHSG